MKTSAKILLSTFIITLLLILGSLFLIKNYISKNSEKASGIIKTRIIEVPAFENIMISGEFDVKLTQSDKPSINVTVDEVFQKHIKVGVTNNTLNISSINFVQTFGARIEIFYTSLKNIQLMANAKLTHADTLNADYLKIQATAASTVTLSGNFNHLICSATAGSKIVLAGYAEIAEFTIEAGSKLHALELEIQQCDIKTSSGSTAEVHVSNTLDASADSGSSIIYKGSPQMNSQNTSSGASVRKLKSEEE